MEKERSPIITNQLSNGNFQKAPYQIRAFKLNLEAREEIQFSLSAILCNGGSYFHSSNLKLDIEIRTDDVRTQFKYFSLEVSDENFICDIVIASAVYNSSNRMQKEYFCF